MRQELHTGRQLWPPVEPLVFEGNLSHKSMDTIRQKVIGINETTFNGSQWSIARLAVRSNHRDVDRSAENGLTGRRLRLLDLGSGPSPALCDTGADLPPGLDFRTAESLD
jgi:hypothetical protein